MLSSLLNLPNWRCALQARPQCPSAQPRPSHWRSVCHLGHLRCTWFHWGRPPGWFLCGCSSPGPVEVKSNDSSCHTKSSLFSNALANMNFFAICLIYWDEIETLFPQVATLTRWADDGKAKLWGFAYLSINIECGKASCDKVSKRFNFRHQRLSYAVHSSQFSTPKRQSFRSDIRERLSLWLEPNVALTVPEVAEFLLCGLKGIVYTLNCIHIYFSSRWALYVQADFHFTPYLWGK